MAYRNFHHHSHYHPNHYMQQNPYQHPVQHPYGYFGHHYPMPNQQDQGKDQGNKQPQNIPAHPFLGADGSFDFNKAINHFDQFMQTANQISPIMKQIGSLLKR